MIRVLIVEDDPMVAMINKRYVESVKGFTVSGVCRDEGETLNFLKTKTVDLIILDVYLPKGDGVSILTKLRRANIGIDVIMVTASTEKNVIDNTLKLGVVDYLVKPFEYERLKKALERYMTRREILGFKREIEQKDIDKIFDKEPEGVGEIQKGLNKYTLNSIVDVFHGKDNETLSAEDIANTLNLSTVTIRRYLDYLERTGYLIREVEYGTVGRPTYIYRKVRN